MAADLTSPASPALAEPLSPGAPRLRGRFVWHELLARDAAAAKVFYPAVAGWSVLSMDFPGGDAPYVMFANGGAPLGGIQPFPSEALSKGAVATWLPYVGTEDVDATCRAAVAAGGTVLVPATDLPTVGRIAVLRDPQGAPFAVYTPLDPPSPEAAPVVGEFAWHEMMCADPVAALDFYAGLFGWEKRHAMDMGKDGIYQMYGLGEHTYGGFYHHSATSTAAWNCYIRVRDLDAACAALLRSGGTITVGPHEVPDDDRIVTAVDDQGTLFSLVAKIIR
jgi:hypothetical protein